MNDIRTVSYITTIIFTVHVDILGQLVGEGRQDQMVLQVLRQPYGTHWTYWTYWTYWTRRSNGSNWTYILMI